VRADDLLRLRNHEGCRLTVGDFEDYGWALVCESHDAGPLIALATPATSSEAAALPGEQAEMTLPTTTDELKKAYNRGWADGHGRGLDACQPVIDALGRRISELEAAASPGDERLRELAAEAAQYGSTLATLLTILPAECQQDGDACAAHNAEWSTRNGADLGHCEWIEARAEIVPEWRSAEHALRAALAAEETP